MSRGDSLTGSQPLFHSSGHDTYTSEVNRQAVTLLDLRSELLIFARGVLRNELQEFRADLRRDICVECTGLSTRLLATPIDGERDNISPTMFTKPDKIVPPKIQTSDAVVRAKSSNDAPARDRKKHMSVKRRKDRAQSGSPGVKITDLLDDGFDWTIRHMKSATWRAHLDNEEDNVFSKVGKVKKKKSADNKPKQIQTQSSKDSLDSMGDDRSAKSTHSFAWLVSTIGTKARGNATVEQINVDPPRGEKPRVSFGERANAIIPVAPNDPPQPLTMVQSLSADGESLPRDALEELPRDESGSSARDLQANVGQPKRKTEKSLTIGDAHDAFIDHSYSLPNEPQTHPTKFQSEGSGRALNDQVRKSLDMPAEESFPTMTAQSSAPYMSTSMTKEDSHNFVGLASAPPAPAAVPSSPASREGNSVKRHFRMSHGTPHKKHFPTKMSSLVHHAHHDGGKPKMSMSSTGAKTSESGHDQRASVDLEMLRLGKRLSRRSDRESSTMMKRFHSRLGSLQTLEDESDATSLRDVIEYLVYSPSFEYAFVFLIVANAVTIGMQTDYMARHVVESTPRGYVIVETIFCVLFFLEIVLRVLVNWQRFFKGPGAGLNVLDIVLVVLQISEMSISWAFREGELHGKDLEAIPSANFFVLRLLRIIRIVRIARTVRLLRFVGEVRAIIWSVAASIRPLLGAILIILLLTYVTGIIFTEVSLVERASIEDRGSQGYIEMTQTFGSLGDTMFSLYQSISGGVDWKNVSDVLILNGLTVTGRFVFPLFIAFTLLALMNVITGVFVDTAIQKSRIDKESYTIVNLKRLFTSLDHNQRGYISFVDFKKNIETREMQELFKSIDLDISEVKSVFQLLDLNNNGHLDADEFMGGCLRLKGHAKAIDVLLLMREMRRIFHILLEGIWVLQEQIDGLDPDLEAVSEGEEHELPDTEVGPIQAVE